MRKINIGSLFPLLSRCLHLLCGTANACRFEPTCSRYAEEAFAIHGVVKGVALTIGRLMRCRPGGGTGYDPVKRG